MEQVSGLRETNPARELTMIARAMSSCGDAKRDSWLSTTAISGKSCDVSLLMLCTDARVTGRKTYVSRKGKTARALARSARTHCALSSRTSTWLRLVFLDLANAMLLSCVCWKAEMKSRMSFRGKHICEAQAFLDKSAEHHHDALEERA